MTKVYFVRHAAPNFNNHDDLTRELTAQGLKDRELVTKFLWDKGIDHKGIRPYQKAGDNPCKRFQGAKGGSRVDRGL